MKEGKSISSSVDVAVDPDTAFAVFTEEVDCWWMQGPINFHDSTRAYGNRIEPGVGGRVLEVYDPETSDGFELGKITAWEPGRGLAWKSSIDDVATEVRFDPTEGGTRVTVVATLPEGGDDRGGTAWVRMTPVWLGRWVARRGSIPHVPHEMARVALAVHYADPISAARWLRDVFGFELVSNLPIDPEDDHFWIEFHVGSCSIVIYAAPAPERGPTVTHTPWVFVDDLDEQYARIKQGGGTILEEIEHHGARSFMAADIEGNHWTFAQATPLMAGVESRGVRVGESDKDR